MTAAERRQGARRATLTGIAGNSLYAPLVDRRAAISIGDHRSLYALIESRGGRLLPRESLVREKQSLGFYVSGHPLHGVEQVLLSKSDMSISTILEGNVPDGHQVTIGGILTGGLVQVRPVPGPGGLSVLLAGLALLLAGALVARRLIGA